MANTQTRAGMSTGTSLMIGWLNDAFAMENAIVEALEKQVDATGDHPMVQSRIQQHLDATKQHAETVKTCLAQLGEEPSGAKRVLAELGGKVQGMAMGAAKDDIVKFALNDYATEHMEIASYKALIIAAQELGQTGIADACRQILRDEEQMAAWLDGQLPTVVREAVVAGQS